MIFRALGALAVGALAVYFFDPVSGKRRRALVRDKMVHYRKEAREYAAGTAKDLRNRAQGVVAEVRHVAERRLGRRSETAQTGQPTP
jgi:gas vesicle protein